MRVRAKKLGQKYSGYYGLERRRPGSIFIIEGEKVIGATVDGVKRDDKYPPAFSHNWMEEVTDDEPLTNSPGPRGLGMADRDMLVRSVETNRKLEEQKKLDVQHASGGYTPAAKVSKPKGKPKDGATLPDRNII